MTRDFSERWLNCEIQQLNSGVKLVIQGSREGGGKSGAPFSPLVFLHLPETMMIRGGRGGEQSFITTTTVSDACRSPVYSISLSLTFCCVNDAAVVAVVCCPLLSSHIGRLGDVQITAAGGGGVFQ